MKYAYNVPGYVMGHRFSSDRRFYDATQSRFIDLAGYGDLDQHCVQIYGAAAFSLLGANNREGLLLNGSNHWYTAFPVPWEGCVVFVVRPHIVTLNKTLRWWNVGNNATLGQNTGITAVSTAVAGNVNIAGSTVSGGIIWPSLAVLSDQITVFAVAIDQETRQGSITKDGVNILTSAAVAAGANGKAIAYGAAAYAGTVGLLGDPKIKMERIGNNVASGAIADQTADAVDYIHIFERHCFKGHPLRDNLSDVKDFMDSLKAYYGAP